MIVLISSGSVVYNGECFSGIYGWQNHVTSKWYVGESIHVPDRVKEYFGKIKSSMGAISGSFSKHGTGSFSCYKLEECPVEILHEREVFWGTELNSLSPNGYNLKLGGSGKSLVSNKTRVNMSAGKMGSKQSPEHCAKRSAAMMGNKNGFGDKSKSWLGKKRPPFSAKWITNISASAKAAWKRRKDLCQIQ